MRKSVFVLAVIAGASFATATTRGAATASVLQTTESDSARETPTTDDRTETSPRAACKMVEVQLDEGYGISSREMRSVCGEYP